VTRYFTVAYCLLPNAYWLFIASRLKPSYCLLPIRCLLICLLMSDPRPQAILACQVVLQIDIGSGYPLIVSDRKALLRSQVAFIFDKGWLRA
jgi:hypothetical protein